MHVLTRLRGDRGFTLVEAGIAGFIGALVLALATTLLIVAYRTGNFTQGQGFTLNDGRNALQQLEKEIRGASSIVWCATDGSCLEIDAQNATGGFRLVRYTHADKDLRREIYDPENQTWTDTGVLIQRVANAQGEPVFSCEENATLLRVTVDLKIEPTPKSDPTLNLHTSVRPRNFAREAECPA